MPKRTKNKFNKEELDNLVGFFNALYKVHTRLSLEGKAPKNANKRSEKAQISSRNGRNSKSG